MNESGRQQRQALSSGYEVRPLTSSNCLLDACRSWDCDSRGNIVVPCRILWGFLGRRPVLNLTGRNDPYDTEYGLAPWRRLRGRGGQLP